MSQNSKPLNKIFCLEGEWHDTDLRDKSSVEPYLRYLADTFGIHYVFRKINCKTSLVKYLNNFNVYQKSKYRNFNLVYLAFHGDSKMVYFDKDESVTLEELASLSGGSFSGKTVHFGSCRTLKVHEKDLIDFLRTSNAKAVSGFSKNVDFMESTLFDMAYLHKLAHYEKTGHIYNWMWDKYERLCQDLGFEYHDINSQK